MKNIFLVIFILVAGFQSIAQETIDVDDIKVYSFVQTKAQPKEGIYQFMDNFLKAFSLNGLPISNLFELKVKLRFIVEKDGSFSDIRIVSEDCVGAGEEAIRVLKTMPAWKPATHNGKMVRSAFTLPMKIRVNEEDKKTEETEEVEETGALITVSTVETEYFKLKCNDCTVRTGISETDYRIESKDKSVEYQITIMQVPEDIGNELVEMLNENVQDPNATFKDITFLDIPMKEIGFYSYGLRNPYIQIVLFYKNGHFIGISASSSKPELAVKFMNELKQTFKLKI